MSAEHNHEPRCCCDWNLDNPLRKRTCPACPDHGDLATPQPHPRADAVDLVGALRKAVDAAREHRLAERAATPYTEQETTNG